MRRLSTNFKEPAFITKAYILRYDLGPIRIWHPKTRIVFVIPSTPKQNAWKKSIKHPAFQASLHFEKEKKEFTYGTWTGVYTTGKKVPVALPPEPGGTWGAGKCGNLFIRCRDNSLCVIQFGARYLLLGANILGMLLLPLPGRATSSDPSGFLFKMLCILTILLLLLLAKLARQSASPARLQIYME